jgi:hypothetical protein
MTAANKARNQQSVIVVKNHHNSLSRCTMKKILILACLFAISSARAQYWHVMPYSATEHTVNAGFSTEDKKGNYRIYFLDNGNIFGLDPKKDSTYQVTQALPGNPVVRMIHLLGKNDIVYMQGQVGNATDYHLYRIADSGSAAEDLTPTKLGVQNIMLGASYNGRYIYYSSNKTNLAKTDYYRYDIAQNISEIVFANTKQLELMGWSRDQNLVLIKDPTIQKLFGSDVQTTERYNFYTASQKILMAEWSVDGKQLLVLEEGSGGTELKALPVTSLTSVGTTSQTITSGISTIDFSNNGKYSIETKAGVMTVKDAATGAEIYTSPNLVEMSTSQKETQLLLVERTAGGKKMKLFDPVKKMVVKEFSKTIGN